MSGAGEDVYCTLLMSDSYLPGAAVLAHSLRDSGTSKKLAVLITPDSILHSTITELKKLYDYVLYANKIANPNLENLARLDRLDLRFAFTKIALWRQQQFRKIVYIDADVVALRAPDELFNIDAPLAAAPDIGWPDIFNSGVMVLKPNMGEYWSLHTLASSGTSFDGADQGLLNEHFSGRPWHRISFTYNCTPNASYQYEPAYRHFRSSINMVHFIGKEKPWTQGREALSASGSGVYKELLGRWWATYDRHYRYSQSTAHGLGESRVVQQYVKDNESNAAYSWAAQGLAPQQAQHDSNGHAQNQASSVPPAPSTEPLDTTAGEAGDRHSAEPPRTPEQHMFSPPHMQWDATQSEPPAESKPEAASFPTQQYEMSQDPGLFHPPRSYPEPPRDMYYKVPEIKPAPMNERPPAIFPWEQNQKKATRVFADEPQANFAGSATISPDKAEPLTPSAPSTPTIRVTPTDSFSSFNLTNAWDNISSIDHYVRTMKEAQARRGKVQVIHQDPGGVSSPTRSPPIKRRESLLITDFPTDVERPSLPVTPAAVQRTSFWGGEGEEESQLPSAEGVPGQSEWNPVERLEQLRRSSLIATDELPNTTQKDLPLRDIPESSALPPSIDTTIEPATPLLPSVLPKDPVYTKLPEEPPAEQETPTEPKIITASKGPVEPVTSLPAQALPRRDMSSLDEYSIA